MLKPDLKNYFPNLVLTHDYILNNFHLVVPIISSSGNGIHYIGDLVTVTCAASQEYAIVHWMLNNTQYDYSQPNIKITTVCTVSFITINNISQDYHYTAIRCEGSYTNGQSFSSDEVTILLQVG